MNQISEKTHQGGCFLQLQVFSGSFSYVIDEFIAKGKGYLDALVLESDSRSTESPSKKRKLNLHPHRFSKDPAHYPEKFTGEENKRKNCTLCYSTGKTRKTFFICDQCKVPLCVDGCFKNYHIKPQ